MSREPMLFESRPFAELQPAELYELLRLRSAVFVVEQNCVHLELDGKDPACEHLLGRIDGRIHAVSRWLGEGPWVRLGRIVTSDSARGDGYGGELMRQSLQRIGKYCPVVINAQIQHQGFYEQFGFRAEGEAFDEDGIDHFRMTLRPAARAAGVEVFVTDFETVRPLRLGILRPNHEIPKAIPPAELVESNLYLAVREQDKIIGVASFYRQAPPQGLAGVGDVGDIRDKSWRLRGMAVEPEQRGRGIGRALIEEAKIRLSERSTTDDEGGSQNDLRKPGILWFNARTSVQAFYESIGSRAEGDVFEIEGIGPHVVMTLPLSPSTT